MLKTNLKRVQYLFIAILFSSCVYDFDEEEIDNLNSEQELNFEVDFDFGTSSTISIETLNGDGTYTLTYGDNDEFLLGKFVAKNSPKEIIVPSHIEEIHLSFTAVTGDKKALDLNVNTQQIFQLDLTTTSKNGRMEGCNEMLYAVNNKGGFYQINVENGEYSETNLGSLEGGGSIACAVDKSNGLVYYNVGQTLRTYNYQTNSFHSVHQGNPFNGTYPRMEFNPVNGHLYIARNEDMYIIDPISNVVLESFSIVGLEAPVGGGDIAISQNGTIYMCCFSGLYRVEIDGGIANATRISAENLPFQPTSMAIDRNDRLYLATNDAKSQLIEMDKYDGAWNVVKTFDHTVNDLGSFKCDVADLSDQDSDNDGVIDAQDDYPNDPTAATTAYTPSDIGWGSLAFEDLWPSQGDYDFNDLVVNYRFIQVENADNEVVRLIGKFKVKAIGASLHNGFGFKIPVDERLISSVIGSNLTTGTIELTANGVEAGHGTGAVIMVFDDAFDNVTNKTGGWFVNTQLAAPKAEGQEIEVVIEFIEPIASELIGLPPFDPFIFIGQDRGREVHLPDHAPTALADLSFFNTFHDATDAGSNKYYRGLNNMPWALNIIHDFKQPIEKTRIDKAYNKFKEWGQSKGTVYKDWYTDVSGYRNLNKIYNK